VFLGGGAGRETKLSFFFLGLPTGNEVRGRGNPLSLDKVMVYGYLFRRTVRKGKLFRGGVVTSHFHPTQMILPSHQRPQRPTCSMYPGSLLPSITHHTSTLLTDISLKITYFLQSAAFPPLPHFGFWVGVNRLEHTCKLQLQAYRSFLLPFFTAAGFLPLPALPPPRT
jgi:hypothetical protein